MDKKRWSEKKSISFKMIIFTVGGIILITAGGAMGYFLVTGQEEEISYREETVLYGELTVGMQEYKSVCRDGECSLFIIFFRKKSDSGRDSGDRGAGNNGRGADLPNYTGKY